MSREGSDLACWTRKANGCVAAFSNWSALEDDFRTFLLLRDGSHSVFQQFRV